MTSGNNTVVCIDGSEHSERAFSWYCNTLHREGDKVILVHVFQMPYMPIGLYEDGLLIDSACEKTIEDSIAESKAIVERFSNLCKDKKIDFTAVLRPCEESIGHTICTVTKDEKGQNIVIGQRGLGILRRTLLGSVSDYVLHHSHIPTIVIPPGEEKND